MVAIIAFASVVFGGLIGLYYSDAHVAAITAAVLFGALGCGALMRAQPAGSRRSHWARTVFVVACIVVAVLSISGAFGRDYRAMGIAILIHQLIIQADQRRKRWWVKHVGTPEFGAGSGRPHPSTIQQP